MTTTEIDALTSPAEPEPPDYDANGRIMGVESFEHDLAADRPGPIFFSAFIATLCIITAVVAPSVPIKVIAAFIALVAARHIIRVCFGGVR